MSFLKPKMKTAASNVNQKLVTDMYTPQAQAGVGATNFLQALLTGKGDVAGAEAGYQNYLDKAGYQNALNELSRSVVGGGAASGLLRSGATSQALLREGTKLNQGFYNNYLQNLGSLAGIGNQGGQLLVGAGSGEPYKSPSTAGTIASGVGKIFSLFSDRRLKENIVKIDEMPDGLGVYEFNYIWSDERTIGVMADEVEKLRPWALGPVVDGYATVNYGAL